MISIPTIHDVERIAALDDPVLRNLQITQCYHELSSAMQARTRLGANWCTFATWASKQAGQTIRKEDLKQALNRVLFNAPATAIAAEEAAVSVQDFFPARLTGGAPGLHLASSAEALHASSFEALNLARAMDHTSQAVSRGNLRVFAEIGREFARFFAACLGDQACDPGKIAAFCEELRPGDPPEGQGYLRQAFTHYYAAFFEPEARRRTELMLFANLEIGFHEQTRLQPEIRAALDAPLADTAQFAYRLIAALFPWGGWLAVASLTGWWLILRLLGRTAAFDAAVRALYTAVQTQARRALTEALMVITLPGGRVLRLGDDLRTQFPAALRQIADPELNLFLERIDPTPDSLRESGALDWAELPERLHFIADLFRCYHETADLFEQPFTPAQVEALTAGRLPAGAL